MVVGIEATNIRAGGGITHLKELLSYATPKKQGVSKVIIWSGKSTLDQLPEKEWLEKRTHKLLDKSIFHRIWWLKLISKNQFSDCDILFAPGGLYSGSFHPYVSMSQNMLVFEQKERARFGYNLTRLRLKILSYVQSKSFKNAEGVLFISNYAKKYISNKLRAKFKSSVVYHGISDRFRSKPRRQREASELTINKPLNLLYVSIVNVYKHQDVLAKAIHELNDEGFHIKLTMVGASYPISLKKLKPLLNENVEYVGKIPFEEIDKVYHDSDVFIFASTCENMPNILVEAMSAGLPVLSSNYGPMPEILTENGLYFDPCDIQSVKKSIKLIYSDDKLRTDLSQKSYDHSKQFNWENCANQTFEFLVNIAKDN